MYPHTSSSCMKIQTSIRRWTKFPKTIGTPCTETWWRSTKLSSRKTRRCATPSFAGSSATTTTRGTIAPISSFCRESSGSVTAMKRMHLKQTAPCFWNTRPRSVKILTTTRSRSQPSRKSKSKRLLASTDQRLLARRKALKRNAWKLAKMETNSRNKKLKLSTISTWLRILHSV